MMQSIVPEIPGEVASQIKLPPKRAKQILMEELVIRLYEQEIITAAQGSRPAEFRQAALRTLSGGKPCSDSRRTGGT